MPLYIFIYNDNIYGHDPRERLQIRSNKTHVQLIVWS